MDDIYAKGFGGRPAYTQRDSYASTRWAELREFIDQLPVDPTDIHRERESWGWIEVNPESVERARGAATGYAEHKGLAEGWKVVTKTRVDEQTGKTLLWVRKVMRENKARQLTFTR